MLHASEQIQQCYHKEDERVLEGTWVILEVIEAVKLGYQILKIFEVWNFPYKEKYDRLTKSGGLFTEYVALNTHFSK